MIEPFYQDEAGQITIHNSDALAVMATLPDASVDLIATDPPYFRVKGEWWDRQWDSRDGFLTWFAELSAEWRRILKPNGSLYVFASPDMAWHVEGVIRERFNVLNSIRWVKEDGWHQKTEKEELRSFLSPWETIVFAEQEEAGNSPMADAIFRERERAGLTCNDVDVALGYVERAHPERGSRLSYRWETGSSLPTKDDYERLRVLLNERGNRPAEYLRQEYEDLRRPFALSDRAEWSDVWRFKTVPPRYGKHPCAKPLALMEHIIRASSRPDALVLDCFMGHGVTLRAARNLGRRAVGVDLSEPNCRSAVAFLSQAVLPFELPA